MRRLWLALLAVAYLGLASCDLSETASYENKVVRNGDPARGRALIASGVHGCTTCHTVPGIGGVQGVVGPPLDGLGRRGFIAGQLPNMPSVLCAFGLNNVKLLLNSGIGQPYNPATGQGTVGRNYTNQTMASVNVFYPESVRINPFMGAGALGTVIDDYNGDNFDHAGLGFVGGGYIAANSTGARPIEYHPVPPGTSRWGLAWKQAVRRHYNHTVNVGVHGSSMATRHNYLSLDPTYRDAYGQPMLRLTFDFPDNDVRMANYVTDRAVEIARLMGGEVVVPSYRSTPYSIVPYQTTHNTGGAIMGTDPKTSTVNRYLQSWDVSNVFVQGACAFPQNPGYNPTGTVGALVYWTAQAIRKQYLKQPGPLVR